VLPKRLQYAVDIVSIDRYFHYETKQTLLSYDETQFLPWRHGSLDSGTKLHCETQNKKRTYCQNTSEVSWRWHWTKELINLSELSLDLKKIYYNWVSHDYDMAICVNETHLTQL